MLSKVKTGVRALLRGGGSSAIASTPSKTARRPDEAEVLTYDASNAIETGVLTLSRLEIARLDQNPNYPERGLLALSLGGGK